MTFRDSAWPEGTPCWVDVMVPDPKRAAQFYGSLFGWEFADQGADYGGYLIASLNGRYSAAVGPLMQDSSAAWTTYLAVTDADRTAAKITEAGGQVIVPPDAVASAGRLAIAVDPTGAMFGIWQAQDHPGIQVANAPGAVVWNDVMTRDFEAAKSFYAQVFGYKVDNMSEGEAKYAVFKVDDHMVGGVGALPADAPADVPARWMTYFGVADTDAAVAKIAELDGTVTSAPVDSPYGRMAEVTDNQSVSFNVISVSG